uniref:Uncharacterized protein n=1 Tax=Acrobeloides nanus TaxID=290746 RepID=A0A914CLW0_9BILA
MDKLNSLDISYYDDDAANLCLYANLIEFAKAHGYGDLTIEQILATNELEIERQIREENFVLLLVVGIPGIILSITVIVVIALKKGVTSFGRSRFTCLFHMFFYRYALLFHCHR